MTTTIRKAGKHDVDQLAVLFDRYRIFYRYPSDLKGARHFLKDRLHRGDAVIFVAEHDNKMVGFVQLYPTLSSTRMARLWTLNDLFVDREYRGNGISKLFIEKAKSLCAETQGAGVQLETEKSNVIGNNLYRTTGFELDSDHNFYFWKNPSP